ncbi:DUF3467 domain-containing protein [Blastopirellula sp. J2-11]|uniref:DUF3467 domain-containing protein n=1 Tax=Blastopirellula sp. J2-11 TaxID=2943192 RepID=UPI0021C8BA1B|nr:DUF3467 domain-containing protein [Blastopirellula sp. J2-11]UUO08803.1 DUF3467 domain-containing protein [Blastopirellula sp. J2-11]
MADAPEKEELTTPEAAAKTAAPQRQQVELDESALIASYANFCRVTGTPEELIIDFALNTQPVGVQQGAIKVSQRIILNYYTAKRMLAALQVSVQRHEAAFGNLEIDFQKRMLPSVRPQG